MARSVGPTAAAISGSLGAIATMPTAIRAISTTFGSLTLPRTSGLGWAEAARYPALQVLVARLEYTARWERLLPETSPEAALPLQAGPTAAAISGSLGARATLTEIVSCSTTFGSSIPPRAYGPGWGEVAICFRPECTARWECLPPETSPDAGITRSDGPTAAAISGSLGAMAAMPATMKAISTTFGSSILPRTYGRGWGEAARLAAMAASPECTARWERLPPETSPEPGITRSVGPTAAAISGSLGAMATMPTAIKAISTTCGNISHLRQPPRR